MYLIFRVHSVKNYTSLSLENPSRSDIIFTHKHGANILQALIDGMLLDDNNEAISSSFNTAALLIAETACGETIQEFILFILGIQQISISSTELTLKHKCNLQILTISLMMVLGRCTGVTTITEYTEKVQLLSIIKMKNSFYI